MKPVTKKVYFYKIGFFGTAPVGQNIAPEVSANDVMTIIQELPRDEKSNPSRILKSSSGVDLPSLILYVTENIIKEKVTGYIASIQESDLPPTFDPQTGDVQPNNPIPLLHRSHFYIDVNTGNMAFQSSKSSPNIAAFAYYIQQKASSIVNSVYPRIYLSVDTIELLKNRPRKSLELQIHSSAIEKTRVLGENIFLSLQNLAKVNNTESVGIILSIGKGKRKGNLDINELVESLSAFLAAASMNLETLRIRTDEGYIDLIEQKFFLSVDFPSDVFKKPNVESIDILVPMEMAYKANENVINCQKI